MSRSRDVSSDRASSQATPDKNPSSNKPKHKRRRTIGFMPLEPRVMYDGAAVATAATTHHHHHADGGPINPSTGNPVTNDANIGGGATPAHDDGHHHDIAPIVPMPTVTTWVKNPTEIVFIDTKAPDYQLLAAGVKPGIEVVELDPNSDGVEQIANFLKLHPDPNLTTIDIVAHGSDGMLFLGNTVLDNNTVGQYATQLAQIGAAVQPGGNLMLYGCDVVADPTGLIFLDQITQETGLKVAASTGPVGSAAEGGSWALNASSGLIDASSPFTAATMAKYPDVLNADIFSVISGGQADGILYGTDTNSGGAATGVTNVYSGNNTNNAVFQASSLQQIQLDPQDGLYFVLLDDNGGGGPSKILELSLTALLNNPTAPATVLATPFQDTNTANSVNAFYVDVADNVIFVNDIIGNNGGGAQPTADDFDVLTFSGAHFTGSVTTTVHDLGAQYLDGMVVDPLAKTAYFYFTQTQETIVGPHGGTTGLATSNGHHVTGNPTGTPGQQKDAFVISENALFQATWTGPNNNTGAVTLTQLPISGGQTIGSLANNVPTSDGIIEDLAVNNQTGVLYFDTGSEDGSAAGIYSYNPSTKAIGTVYTANAAISGGLTNFIIDPQTNKYYVTTANGTTNEIYDGSLGGGNPSLFINVDTVDSALSHGGAVGMALDNSPTLATSASTVTANQDGPAVVVDRPGSGIVITDSDASNGGDNSGLASATVSITTNFETGDTLAVPIADLSGTNITQSYNNATGVLTLSGSDTIAHYEAVLDDVTFSTTSGVAQTARTVTFAVSDGLLSASATDTVNVHVLPVVGGTASVTAQYYQGSSTILDSAITVTDPGTSIAGATVTIGSTNLLAGDTLSFNGTTNTESFSDGSTITATYGGGVLQLTTTTGTASAADYQTALQKVQYFSSSGDPTNGGADPTRTISWTASDTNGLTSTAVTTALDVYATPVINIGTNTPTPTVTTSGVGVAADPGLTITDHNTGAFTTTGSFATVQINGGFQTGDELTIGGLTSGTVPTTTISFSYNTTTHSLLLSGADSLADYQKALDEVQFVATSPNSGARTLLWSVNDQVGGNTNRSGAVISTVDAAFGPVTTAEAASLLEGATASGTGGIAGTGALHGDSDPSGGNLDISAIGGVAGAVGSSIAGTYGHLTLNADGSYSYVADITTAINAAAAGSKPVDTFQYTVTDTAGQSTLATITFTVDRPPVVVAESAALLESAAKTGNALQGDSDPDGDSLSVTAVTGGAVGSALSGTYGVLTLNANGSYSYSASNTAAINAAASGSEPVDTFNYTVSDGHGGTTTAQLSFTIDRPPVVVAESATVVAGATATGTASTAGTGALHGDSDPDGEALSVTAVAGGTVGSAVSGTYGVLTLNADGGYSYAATNTAAINAAPSGSLVDSFSYTVSDGHGGSTVAQLSFTIERPPAVTAGASVTFDGGSNTPLTLDSGLTLAAPTNSTIASATVTDVGLVTGDILAFANNGSEGNIAGSYNTTTGVLTLTSAGNSATLAQWQAALDSVTYSFSPQIGDPTNGGGNTSRTIQWQVTDTTSLSSAAATSTLNTVHEAPTINAANATVFVAGGAAVPVDLNLTLDDPDSGNVITGATVTISNGLLGGDTLSFTPVGDISGSYNSATGVLSLSGTGTIAQYQRALASVTYQSTAADPGNGGTDTMRTISWTVTDGSTSNGTSTTVFSTILIDSPPRVTANGSASYTGGGNAVALDGGISLSDSFGTLSGATVTIEGAAAGDVLNFTNQNGITGVFSGNELILSGNATTAQYRAALASVTYSDGNADPTVGGTNTTRLIAWQVTDTASLQSNISTSTLNTSHVAPTVVTGANNSQSYDGGSAASGALDNTLVITDVDSGGNLAGATVQIVSPVAGEVLNFTALDGVTSSYSNGVLTITGTASIADYQTMLRSVTVGFSPQNLDPTAGGTVVQQAVYWVVNDGNSVNGTNETFPVTNSINNDQPTLGLNQIVVVNGIFPSRTGDSTDGIPEGAIRTFAGLANTITGANSASADGQTLPINQEPALFSLLGTNYGGNGISNFGLPNLQSTIIVGTDGSNSTVGDSFGSNQLTLSHQNLPHILGGIDSPFDNDQPSLDINYIINVSGQSSGNSTNVIGEVIPFLGTYAPAGYAFANGQVLSVASNQSLFDAIGYTYGGNGTTTFALPDLNGKTIIGAGQSVQTGQLVQLGATMGQDSTTLTDVNLPSPIGIQEPVSNYQPSLALTYLVATQGIFPSTGGFGEGEPDVGEVIAYAGTPTQLTGMLEHGWAIANGQQLSIQSNEALFAVIGNTYGGNGQTTFALPDLVGRAVAGVGSSQGVTTSLGEDAGTTSFTLLSGNAFNQNIPVPIVATSYIDLIHEPPVVTAGATTTFDGGESPVQIDSTLTVSAPDSSDTITGATVQITNGFHTGDTLNFNTQNGISEVSYSNGQLVLTGTATAEQYQAALESITYSFSPANGDPTVGNTDTVRTIDYVVNDGQANSATATSTLDVVHTPPSVTAGASTTFQFGSSPVALDSTLTLSDPDSGDILTGATVKIDNGFLAGDSLNFINQNGIGGSYSNGVLTLTGNATSEQYQAALDSITFSTTNQTGTSHTIDWTVSDSVTTSAVATSTLTVGVGPLITAGAVTTFTGGSATAVPLDSGLTVTDLDGQTDLTGATVKISSGFINGDMLNFANQNGITGSYSGGVLTLSGNATVAQYQAALDSITYSFSPSNGDPTNGGGDTTRTISWQTADAQNTSPVATSTLNTTHVAPTVTAGGVVTFTGGSAASGALDPTLQLTDVDSGDMLTGATVEIAGGYLPGDTLNFTTQNGISGTYHGSSGTLSLQGTATVAEYQAALESITYSFTSGGDPTLGGRDTSRGIGWLVTDGSTSNGSASGTSTLDIVHAAPTVSAGSFVEFNGGGAPVTLDSTLTVTNIDSNDNLTGATIAIAGGFNFGDTLNFTNQNGITEASYANGVLTLTGHATFEQYQAALRSITYSFSPGNGDPSSNGFDFRIISWSVNDGNSSNGSGGDTSLLEVNHVPPTVSAGGTATFTGGSTSPVALDSTLALTDVDSSDQISGATVTISSGLITGDTLNFTTQNGISGTYTNGVLTLQGLATVAQYQTALESVSYSFTAGADPTAGGTDTARGITWSVNDGNGISGIGTDTSTLDTVHVPPAIQAGASATFTGGSTTPVTLDGALKVTNIDSNDQLTGATVTISSGLAQGDTLNFTGQNGITGSYNTTNGVLTLQGNATVEQYQAALDSVTYSFLPANGDPTAGGGDTARTISWTVNDGNPTGNTATDASTLTAVHVAPALTTGGTVTFVQSGSPVTADGTLTLSDVDSNNMISGATVQITSGLLAGDTLSAITTGEPAITATYSNGVLTLSGTDTVADYQAVLQSVAFSSSSNDPTNAAADPSRTLTWTVNDGASTNATTQTSTVDVHAQPTVVAGAAATFTGGGSAVPLDGTITLGDFSSANLTGATVSITSGLIGADTLNFTNQNGITGSYSNGVLTLQGTATVAEYQTALDSITYSTSPAEADPTNGGGDTARTISWQVTDGVATSAAATSTLTTVHVAPTVLAGATETFIGGSTTPVQLDGNLISSSPDSNNMLEGATVTITSGLTSGDTLNFTAANGITGSYSNGVLTLSGSATVQDYNAVLHSVTYSFSPTDGDPTAGGGDTSRTISWTVNDGNTSNNTGTDTSTLIVTHVPPNLTTGGTVTFVQSGSPVTTDSALTLSDVDSNNMISGATVQITSGLLAGDSLTAVTTGEPAITATYSNGVLTLSGTDTVADYQAVLRSVAFSSSSNDPTNSGADQSRTLTWTVNDGASTNATTQTSTIDVHALPTIVAGAAATFTGGGAAVPLDGTIALGDFSSKGLTGATVSITSGLIGADTLNFTNQNGITGSYSNGVLTLSGSATVAEYQAALDSITYVVSTPGDPTGGGTDTARTISWQVTDGVATSAVATSTLTTVHVPATLKADAPVTFTQNGPAVAIDATLALDDVDSNGQLTGATVSINSGLQPGDILTANTAGTSITANYSNGVLTLTGADTVADYKAVLQSVKFSSNSSDPTREGTDVSRGITWTVNDGASTTTATGSVNVSAVPTVVAGADASFQAGPNKTIVLDAPIGVFDDTPLTGATVTIASGFQSGDVLTANTNGTSITASYNNGVLTLTGNDTQQHYQAVMASVTMSSTQFQDGKATIDWQVTDNKGHTSEAATSTVEIKSATGSLPLNNQGNPLPPPNPFYNQVAQFSGMLTNASFNNGAGPAFEGYSPPGAVHVVHSDVIASIGPDGNVAFNLPLDALESALGGDVVSVTASLADGQPLPTWLHFDTQNGQFAGLLPDTTATGSLTDGGFNTKPNEKPLLPEKITIEVIARDSHGNISITDFTIDLVRAPPKHSFNVLPGHGGFEHWGMLRDTAVPLTGEPILWDGELATGIDRDGVIHVADPVPAGRAGFSEQLKVHGLHALNADRAALLKNLRHVNWR